MPDPIKILFLSSNPKDISRIRLDEELREVDERIQLGKFRDRFELIPQLAVRPRDIGRALMRYQPHVLHFSGHGSPTEGIVLEDDEGKTKLVSAEALAKLFTVIKDNLRVVVLNACYSGLQADGIIKAIDCAIGMQKAIGDHSAIVFSAAFYEALAQGRSVEEAFQVGVANLAMEGIPEETTPSLLIKQGVDAAKIYLATREEPSAEKHPVPEPAKGNPISNKTLTNSGTAQSEYGDVNISIT